MVPGAAVMVGSRQETEIEASGDGRVSLTDFPSLSSSSTQMVHYYFVCRGNIVVSRLYDGMKDNPYYFTGGVVSLSSFLLVFLSSRLTDRLPFAFPFELQNWQGYLAYACGIAVPLPGFLVQLKVWNDTVGLSFFLSPFSRRVRPSLSLFLVLPERPPRLLPRLPQ